MVTSIMYKQFGKIWTCSFWRPVIIPKYIYPIAYATARIGHTWLSGLRRHSRSIAQRPSQTSPKVAQPIVSFEFIVIRLGRLSQNLLNSC